MGISVSSGQAEKLFGAINMRLLPIVEMRSGVTLLLRLSAGRTPATVFLEEIIAGLENIPIFVPTERSIKSVGVFFLGLGCLYGL